MREVAGFFVFFSFLKVAGVLGFPSFLKAACFFFFLLFSKLVHRGRWLALNKPLLLLLPAQAAVTVGEAPASGGEAYLELPAPYAPSK